MLSCSLACEPDEEQETAQGKVKIENIISLLDPKKDDSILYDAM